MFKGYFGITVADQAVAPTCGTAFVSADAALLWGITGTEAFAAGASGGLAVKRSIEALIQPPDTSLTSEERAKQLLETLVSQGHEDLAKELSRLLKIQDSVSKSQFEERLEGTAGRYLASE